jgi:hypothetical protein
MMAGEPPSRYAVSDAYRQWQEPARMHLLLKIIRRGKLPQCLLYRDLPRTRSRHDDDVRRIGDCVSRLSGQAFVG